MIILELWFTLKDINMEIIVKGQEVLSVGNDLKPKTSFTDGKEWHEINVWPEPNALRNEVYWDGSQIKMKTQAMIDADNIEKDKQIKLQEIKDKIAELLWDADEKNEDFNDILKKVKDIKDGKT